jgi:hypothetical protein
LQLINKLLFFSYLNNKELITTDIELKDMAIAAISGLKVIG